MEIKRDVYLNRLIAKKHNGMVKVITGIRRCGKSYLLFNLFHKHLNECGVSDRQIIEIALDDENHWALRNPLKLGEYIRSRIVNKKRYYVLIDEIQMSVKILQPGLKLNQVAPEDKQSAYISFYDVLNGLMRMPNVDVYVTGSNSKMLSRDIATVFRDRGDIIQMHPLSFSEYLSAVKMEKAEAWEQYLVYGGMPVCLQKNTSEEKENYLRTLFKELYFRDIMERNRLKSNLLLENLTDLLFSAIGSLTNPRKIVDTMVSAQHVKTSVPTIKKYFEHLLDSFLVNEARRYDVKGRKNLSFPAKFYAEDLGLRNARLNFRQIEQTHLMENAIYNELIARGCAVDVGVVEQVVRKDNRQERQRHEIDFVVNRGAKKIYIQSAFAIRDEGKRIQETLPLQKTNDFFKKIVVTSGFQPPIADENGITFIGVIPFLLDNASLDK